MTTIEKLCETLEFCLKFYPEIEVLITFPDGKSQKVKILNDEYDSDESEESEGESESEDEEEGEV